MQSKGASNSAAGLVYENTTFFPWNSWPILSNLVVSVSNRHRNVAYKSTLKRIISKGLRKACFDVYGSSDETCVSEVRCPGNNPKRIYASD